MIGAVVKRIAEDATARAAYLSRNAIKLAALFHPATEFQSTHDEIAACEAIRSIWYFYAKIARWADSYNAY